MANKTVTVKPSGGTYTTLAAAIAGELVANADLVTMAGILTISVEGSWSGSPETGTTPVSTAGFTQSAAYYVNIVTDSANRYSGKWDTTKYILQITSADHSLLISGDYTRVTGLQVENPKTGDSSIVINIDGQVATNNNIKISKCCAKGSLETVYAQTGIYIADTDALVDIWNSVVWNIHPTTTNGKAIFTNGALVKLENCTFSGGHRGVNNGGNNLCKAINCIAVNTADRAFYDYDYVVGTDYNASDDATAPGANKQINRTITFVDAPNGDFHLDPTDTGVMDLGTTGVTLGFTDDVDGQERTGIWDIGADEYVAAGGGGGTQDIYLRPGHATPEDIILRDPTLADGPGGVALDGVIAATSTFTASLSLTVPLDGSIAAVSALSASLSLTVPLSGVLSGTSTLTAELTVVPAGVNLDGIIAATSALSAELSISKPLDGILAGAGSLSAILSLTKPLAGAIDASSTLSAALSLTVPLSGVVAGASALSAELSLGKPLAGILAGAGALSASLSLTKTLDGAIVATSVLSGVLSLTVPLSGILDGVSTLSGELTVIGFGVNLDGVISAISTLTASLTVEMAVFGRLRLVTPAQPYLPILCRALTHHVLPTTAEAGKTIYTEAAMELHLTCPPIGGHSWS
jgi:hypothetical protein